MDRCLSVWYHTRICLSSTLLTSPATAQEWAANPMGSVEPWLVCFFGGNFPSGFRSKSLGCMCFALLDLLVMVWWWRSASWWPEVSSQTITELDAVWMEKALTSHAELLGNLFVVIFCPQYFVSSLVIAIKTCIVEPSLLWSIFQAPLIVKYPQLSLGTHFHHLSQL